ncbi:MAG: hypothetical protein HPY66_0672 [Firmicutes bacterium]|nr:hypothetical protein [Bacillota bacterium]
MVMSIVLIIITVLVTVKTDVLRIYDADRDDDEQALIYQTAVGEENELILRWKHSVTKQYVIEKFRINEDRGFDVVEMIFNEHGPNLPKGPEMGTKWEIKDGYFRVYNYNLTFNELPVRIGQVVAQHFIDFRGKEIPLNIVDEPGGYVIIRVENVTLLDFIEKGAKIWLRNLA